QPKQGKQCLLLQVKEKTPQQPLEALERTFIAINSPEVSLPPGTPVQISAWVRIPSPIRASVDGAMFYDSTGGESASAIRMTDPTKWKKLTLYREVPANGKLFVTLALTGIGSVFFDDVRIEPLVPATTAAR